MPFYNAYTYVPAAEVEQVEIEEVEVMTPEAEVIEEAPTVNMPESEPVEDSEAVSAFNEETGEINWDCPCLGGMANGPCGEAFKEAFSCFVYSMADPKGVDCVDKFRDMQNCFRQHPDVYGDEIDDDEDEDEVEKSDDTVKAEVTEATAETKAPVKEEESASEEKGAQIVADKVGEAVETSTARDEPAPTAVAASVLEETVSSSRFTWLHLGW